MEWLVLSSQQAVRVNINTTKLATFRQTDGVALILASIFHVSLQIWPSRSQDVVLEKLTRSVQ